MKFSCSGDNSGYLVSRLLHILNNYHPNPIQLSCSQGHRLSNFVFILDLSMPVYTESLEGPDTW